MLDLSLHQFEVCRINEFLDFLGRVFEVFCVYALKHAIWLSLGLLVLLLAKKP